MPPQIGSSSEAVAIQTAGEAAVVSTVVVLGSNFALNLVLSGSLNQVWSMLNSLQASVRAPMYENLKIPANAMMLTRILIQVASFDLINTAEWIDPYVYYLPEEDAYSINFAQCGYESLLLIVNISVIVWMYIANFAVLIIVFGLVWLIHRKTGKLAGSKEKLAGYFFWNGLIRLFYET